MEKRKKRRNDVILICTLAAAAVGAWLLFSLFSSPGATAVVTRDSVEIGRYPLSENVEVRLEDGEGGYNILVIENGCAYISEASCPDKVCVNHRAISRTNETIVCLPNKMAVSITGAAEAGADLAA